MRRSSQLDAGLRPLREVRDKSGNPPPIFIFASAEALEKFGESAKNEGAAPVTSSVRELILKMNTIVNAWPKTKA
jgi:hypothetical protein